MGRLELLGLRVYRVLHIYATDQKIKLGKYLLCIVRVHACVRV